MTERLKRPQAPAVIGSPFRDHPIVDSHCHLDFPVFEADLDDVIQRARDAGVTRMVSICTRPDEVARTQAIAERYEGVYFAAGVHPMSVGKYPMTSVERLEELAAHPKMVAIGETGLDYHYSAETMDQQQESLRIHIEAARRTGLPLVIHARDADADMARILTEEYHAGSFGCVMHCFSSSRDLAEASLKLGFYLSFSGIAAFPRSDGLREIFADVPVDRVLMETDSPYLAPPPHRGRRNEPAFTAHTALVAAEVYGLSPAELARRTTQNFDRLFTKARP